ncbi:MAG: DUF4823 domain-containing protein [Gammaproteobacteria bacterium]|nr:DUF4823 domain-containing protein [Gammaproteobacteria bacterium]MDP2139193.1 DUF4823 domain-containing protein [Gammaproteobacteria bacterium]MDP2349038.1 DUF4823 domain-containing protein [Gammaproteobacteria bacterium]
MTNKLLSLCLLALPLISCTNVQSLWLDGLAVTSQAGLTSEHRIERSGHWVLPRNTSFYVAQGEIPDLEVLRPVVTSPDQGEAVNPWEPDHLGALVAREIARHFPLVLRAEQNESLFAALQSAQQHGIDYVLYPRMQHWQDGAGTWTEVAESLRYRESSEVADAFGLDRARLQLTLLETSSGHIMDVVSIETRGGVLTAYGGNPQRLLEAAVGRYVDSLVP